MYDRLAVVALLVGRHHSLHDLGPFQQSVRRGQQGQGTQVAEEDPAATIKRLLVRMKVGGKLLILQAPKAELNRLADCFWFPNQDVDIWFSETLETYLEGADLAYTKTRIHGRVE